MRLHDRRLLGEYETTFAVGLHADGLDARVGEVSVTPWDGGGLPGFLDGLEADFRGWAAPGPGAPAISRSPQHSIPAVTSNFHLLDTPRPGGAEPLPRLGTVAGMLARAESRNVAVSRAQPSSKTRFPGPSGASRRAEAWPGGAFVCAPSVLLGVPSSGWHSCRECLDQMTAFS